MISLFRYWDGQDRVLRPVRSMNFNDDGEIIMYLDGEEWSLGPDLVLMQSTGLKDRNGVQVYQGDIINCTRGCPHEVIWLEEYGGTFFGGMPAWYLSGLREGYAWTGEEEVIGNIYENPELMEETE